MLSRIIILFVLLLSQVSHASSVDDIDAIRAGQLNQLEALIKNPEKISDSERLAKSIDLLFDYTLLDFPELGTFMGINKYQDRWADNSVARHNQKEAESLRWQALFRSISDATLDNDERLNLQLLTSLIDTDVARSQFDAELMPLSQMSGVHTDIAQFMAIMPARNKTDLVHQLSRLEGVASLIDNTIVWLQMGLEKGITPPKVTMRDIPLTIQNQIADNLELSPFLQGFKSKPTTISEQDFDALKEQAYAVVKNQIHPAMQRLHDYIANDYMPRARETIGMSSLPNGDAWYAFNVREMTTTNMTPKEVHETGLAEVKRIRQQMQDVIRQTGFAGDFKAFLTFLRSDPQFYFTEADALLAEYRNIAKKADAELPKLFGLLPRTPYGVVAVPAYMEKSQTTAYYMPGSLESGRAGSFFANTYALDTRPKYEMEALTLHEAVPGHHLQIAIQQELEDVAWFRKIPNYTGYVEGWGLYSESLGEEMGFYTDPYAKFGQLTYEMWRAIRLVVDTGIHAFGWSRQQAIDYFMENAGKTEHDVIVEVDRYIVWPGQATAYKIGELKIKALRAKAEKALGENFDIRGFHDVVLGSGAVPLTVLESMVDAWIAEQSK